jgi:hypothetical protein
MWALTWPLFKQGWAIAVGIVSFVLKTFCHCASVPMQPLPALLPVAVHLQTSTQFGLGSIAAGRRAPATRNKGTSTARSLFKHLYVYYVYATGRERSCTLHKDNNEYLLLMMLNTRACILHAQLHTPSHTPRYIPPQTL